MRMTRPIQEKSMRTMYPTTKGSRLIGPMSKGNNNQPNGSKKRQQKMKLE
jgi:hypothetical protein